GPDVWMESAAVEQLGQIARKPQCRCAVGMPDLHPGRGIPIGAVFAFADQVIPMLVGGDAGCGVHLRVVAKSRIKGAALERRVLEATQDPILPDVDPDEAMAAVWRAGIAGLVGLQGVPEALARLAASVAADHADTLGASGPAPEAHGLGRQLGTVGGGNHFLELAEVTSVVDKPAADTLGLARGALAVMAHSGSRGAGAAVAQHWGNAELGPGSEREAYLADLAGACRFAQANRFLLVWRMLTALGATRESRLGPSFDLIHNTVVPAQWQGEPVFVHRKGAAPAALEEPTVVLGSRGARSTIMMGAGSEKHLWSVAHGAGRKMGRSEAMEKIRARYTKAKARKSATGGWLVCDDSKLLFQEHPDTYKPVEPVVRSLENAGAARVVAHLTPLITVKR
ncbi:MAG: release factor H-coupled RctB family protein, partial [Myxococcota bacterium]